jgi:hypothetical protein
MNDQFKRMQKLAGLITEGEAAYEYEKGKEAGEKAEKKKMKKSELKKQIKEMILAEIDIDLSNTDSFYDFLAEGELTADSLYKMFEKEGLIDDRREYDEEDLMAAYPGLSQPEAEKLVNKISDGLNEAKKKKKSDLKKQIKEMILAEMNEGRQYGMSPEEIDAFFRKHPEYDEMGIDDKDKDGYQKVWYSDENGLYQYLLMKSEEELEEAKKKKKDKDEEVEDVEVDTDVDMGDEMDMGAEMNTTPVPAASDVQKELMDALEAAKASGDEKLVRQIGNALTYFTRSQVSKEEAPTMSEGIEDTDVSEEAYQRMNDNVSETDYNNFIDSATNIMRDLTKEGFEVVDVFYYLYTRLTAEV